ncbi:LacI family DNA-binding transcriptional regulator [Sphingomonas sp. KR1UV-12]|uniref:LacI family DNA-binding transcriptional regulator n=1 Tax=Sphingomonas aurea TaxID=3063994 RepID=A0ABT9EIB8_9SPHN|nr:LacI family DNA-binding transcriptional regulator [Sphingomonas sp. KR1UV-12]MDP1026706.1 LacI family DNA-binding transcriptional regulator [Sphingomonas sp. KR1UV-12]
MTKRKPTIDDVARLSGVARATVSRVLNGGPNVSERMRVRVQDAVASLGYQVNLQARYLAGGGNPAVLLILSSDTESEPNSYYQAALEIGALRVCAQAGLELVTHTLVQTRDGVDDRIVELVEDSRCTGVIVTPPFSDRLALVDALRRTGVAVVRISPGVVHEGDAPGVGMDDEAAGFALTRHLIAAGHTRFGFIKGLAEHLSAEQRHRGALRALDEAGLDAHAMVAVRGNFTFKAGVDLLPDLVASPIAPTAIICANDDMAVGALFAAHRAGMDVPGDLSLASFDDTPVSALVWPPLTTVHQPIQEMSARAVQIIAAARTAGAGGGATAEFLPFTIVDRASVAAPGR